MDANFPMISVIMGVYNCEKTVINAINSVLNQTYQNFEFIICDDGSVDSTAGIVEKIQKENPEHIVFVKNEKNMGLNYTLNKCLGLARGKYIARMDADDESYPNRFQVEIDYLESHPEIAIVSAALDLFDDAGIWGSHYFKEYPEPRDFLGSNPFSHSACMVKKEAYDAVDGYSEGKWLMRVEDFHLWIKMYEKGYRGHNINEILYHYRDDRDGYNKRKYRYRFNSVYVGVTAIKKLHLPKYGYILILRPLLVGLLPYKLYNYLHKKKLQGGKND